MDTSAVPVADEAEVAADYLPGVRGHAVLATGKDIEGREAVAVRRLGPTGGLNGLTARLSASIGALPRLLDGILHRRRECAAAVDDDRTQTKSELVPLNCARDLPELADAARRVVTPALSFTTAPVAAEALAGRTCEL